MFFRIAIFWKKLIFEKKDIPHIPTLSGKPFFRVGKT